MRFSMYRCWYQSFEVIAFWPQLSTLIWSPVTSRCFLKNTGAVNWMWQSVTQQLASNLAVWISIPKHSESDILQGWRWHSCAFGVVSVRQSCCETGGAPIGSSKRSANAFWMCHCHVSSSAGCAAVDSFDFSSISSICFRILTMNISDYLHLAVKMWRRSWLLIYGPLSWNLPKLSSIIIGQAADLQVMSRWWLKEGGSLAANQFNRAPAYLEY